eukprot:jgi/Galph1/5103/GphlegSOOS_G3789.1
MGTHCFPLPKSWFFLIRVVFLYIQCLHWLPPRLLDVEIVQKLIQLIRFVNQLTSRMVLAAGALHTAGLKSISAKHLALAYQSIYMLSELVDMVISVAETLFSLQQHVLSEFQRTQREFRDHQGQILAKIISIMNDRMLFHQKSLESMPWNNVNLLEQWEIPSPYMQTIVREISVLDRIFQSFCMQREWHDLSNRIISSYAENWMKYMKVSNCIGNLIVEEELLRTLNF